MKVDEFNVDLELNAQIQSFLEQSLKYEDLRVHCLTTRPIAIIWSDISTKLDAISVNEKAQHAQDAIQLAYNDQCRQDLTEENNDAKLSIHLASQIRPIVEKINNYQLQLTTKSSEAATLNHVISEGNHIYRNCQRPRQFMNHHRHPSEIHFVEDQAIAQLSSKLIQVQNQLRELENVLLQLNRSLAPLLDQQQACLLRRAEREGRARWRSSEHLSQTKSESLSKDNAQRLQSNIQFFNNQIDTAVKEKKGYVNEHCHVNFIDQAHSYLHGLKLQPEEIEALNQLLLKMKAYYAAQKTLQQEEVGLNTLGQKINQKQGRIDALTGRYESLAAGNAQRISENQCLTEGAPTLQRQKLKQVALYKRYRNYGLVSLTLISLSAMVGFFLNADLALVMPVAPVIIGVVAATLMIFTVLFAMARFRASWLKSKIETNNHALLTNSRTISDNKYLMTRLANETLPQLKGELKNLQHEMATQENVVKDAKYVVMNLLQEAELIRPLIRATEEKRAFVNPNSFYQPSAPTEAEALDAANDMDADGFPQEAPPAYNPAYVPQ